MGTLLGFDFGPRKIGVAVGQTITGSASPLASIRGRRNKPDWSKIAQLVHEWQPRAAVVGLPFNMDDTPGEIAPQAERFARQLAGRFGLEVHLVDERLTSVEARRRLGRGTRSNGLIDQVSIDAMAAKLILETWLGEQDWRQEAPLRDSAPHPRYPNLP